MPSGALAKDGPYPGTCRDLALPFDGDVGWRVRLPSVDVSFVDRWRGPQTQTPARQCGDLLIRDRRGHWTYQFVATLDDHLQGITDVIRGDDLLPSTGRQILLAEMLGRDDAGGLRASRAGDEVAGTEAQQVGWRHRRARSAPRRLVARRRAFAEATRLIEVGA